MTKQTPRDSALSLLQRSANHFAPADVGLNYLFTENPHFDERDRAFITNLVQGVLRWRLKLDWTIGQYSRFPLEKIDPITLNILRLSVFQILFLDRVPDSAAVNEAVKQSKRHGPRHVTPFVNAVLRRVSSQKDNCPKPDRQKDPQQYLSVEYSYPPWLVQMWALDYGLEFTEKLLAAQNRVPRLVIRANQLQTARDVLKELLEKEGLLISETLYAPEGLLVDNLTGSPDRLATFRKGLFQVQDQAAQIASYLLGPKLGENVLDVCAGLGGKTSHLAEIMDDDGLVLALDINHWRLLSLRRNCQRLGIKRVIPVTFDARAGLSSLFRVGFDRILVDAPCSGLGVLGRHPDGKWNRTEADLVRLAGLQKSILEAAIPVLKRGGLMLYLTCTISKLENEGLVGELLKKNKRLALVDLRKTAPAWCRDLIDEQGFYRTWPHLHQMDGFFGALFEKVR